MLQMDNRTPFATMFGLFPDEQGVDAVFPVLKATFSIGDRLGLAEIQSPVVMVDEYLGEPDKSSLRQCSDMTFMKPATDVLLYGHAYTPQCKPRMEVDVGIRVGQQGKMARVFGDRIWLPRAVGFAPSDPQPFVKLPLTYERCFGGTDPIDDDTVAMIEENPVGAGFHHPRGKTEIAGSRLPNIEDPGQLISSLADRPTPGGFGPSCPGWLPRRKHAGTYDEKWQKSRAPFLPHDFNPRFFNCAPPELQFTPHLKGGERVAAQSVDPDRPLEFKIPALQFRVTVRINGESISHQPVLDTVLVDADNRTVSLVWRCKQECDKKMLQVEVITFEIVRPDPDIAGL